MADIAGILDNVRKTKEIMLKNIDKLLERGQKLEALQSKTEKVADEAKLFAEAAHELQVRAKSRYLALTFVIIGVSLGATYTIINGYGAGVISLGAMSGGVLGYSLNWIRYQITELFSPNNILSSPLKRERLTNRVLPKMHERTPISADRNFLNAYTGPFSDDDYTNKSGSSKKKKLSSSPKRQLKC